jgi:hypothetical protein
VRGEACVDTECERGQIASIQCAPQHSTPMEMQCDEPHLVVSFTDPVSVSTATLPSGISDHSLWCSSEVQLTMIQ